MSNHRHKRHRSRSHSSTNKREFQQNRNRDRSNDYDRRVDSYERHHHQSDLTVSMDEIISHVEEYPPMIQSLVRELLLEQKKRKLVEDRLHLFEHDYALLHAQHEQTINNVTLLKHDFDKSRNDLKNSFIELNELRHVNCQLRAHIDHQLHNEREQIYNKDEMFYAKRQRRN